MNKENNVCEKKLVRQQELHTCFFSFNVTLGCVQLHLCIRVSCLISKCNEPTFFVIECHIADNFHRVPLYQTD